MLPARVLVVVEEEEQVAEQGGQVLGGRVAGLPQLTPSTNPPPTPPTPTLVLRFPSPCPP